MPIKTTVLFYPSTRASDTIILRARILNQSNMSSSLEPGMLGLQIDDNKMEVDSSSSSAEKKTYKISIPYKRRRSQYEYFDDFKIIWNNRVVPAFAEQGFSCTYDEEKMSFWPLKQAPHPSIIRSANYTLVFIGLGVRVDTALRVLSGELECRFLPPIKRPDALTQDEFVARLFSFLDQLSSYNVGELLDCSLICYGSDDTMFVAVAACSIVASTLMSSLVSVYLAHGIEVDEKTATEVMQQYEKYKDKPEDYMYFPVWNYTVD